MAKIKAKGVILKYGDAADPLTTVPQKTEVSLDLGAWDRTDTTDHDTSGSTKEYDTVLKEPPTIDVTGFFDPADTAHAWFISAHASGAEKYFELVMPDAGSAEFVCQAHVSNLSIGGMTPSGHLTFSATLAGTTAATFTA